LADHPGVIPSVRARHRPRGPVLSSIPYFDQRKIDGLLDSLHTMDEGARVANEQVLMFLVSACGLHERLHLAA
jgi:asparagine synthase (glutamine-hydrolysing)